MKSVKKEVGSIVQAIRTITVPSDSLGANAYDSAGVSTYEHIGSGQRKIAVDSSMWNQKIKLSAYFYSSNVSGSEQLKNHQWIKIQKTTGTEIYAYLVYSAAYNDREIIIPKDTRYIIFESGYDSNYYSQIKNISVSINN